MECWNIGNKSGNNLFKLSKNPSNPSFLSSETFFYFTGTIIPLFPPGRRPCEPEAN
jgi:hypothetical protein